MSKAVTSAATSIKPLFINRSRNFAWRVNATDLIQRLEAQDFGAVIVASPECDRIG
jgi:hypothetical protein